MNVHEHYQHMQRMEEGLKRIQTLNDIKEIKAVAKNLLEEEVEEMSSEGGNKEDSTQSLKDKLNEVIDNHK